MVRALLDGTKTQTRRLLRNPEHWGCPTGDCPHNLETECNASMSALRDKITNYRLGDGLWVKETWSHTGTGVWSTNDVHYARDGEVIFRATDNRPGVQWFPSIFMFRKLSRLTLTLTDVRVERLQDCNRGDAMEEGCPFPNMADGPDPRDWYRQLWNDINGKGAWEQNPWVVVLTFDVEARNIDR